MELITLPEDSEKRFAKLEKIIEKNAQAFVQVGWALTVIHDEKLYKTCLGHKTFEDYCKERWGYAKRYSYYLMESAKTLKMLEVHKCAQPTSEGQIRPLSSVPEEDRPEVWNEAVERSDGNVTARVVQEVIDERMDEDEDEEEIPTEAITTYIFGELKALWSRANETDRQAFLSWIGGNHGKNN